MVSNSPGNFQNWLSLLDIMAVADPKDKLGECEFFFTLMSVETERDRFRWLASAFLNAAYSFFESSALTSYFRFTDENGESYEDEQSLEILRRYVTVFRNPKNPNFVKTGALIPITQQLYDFRKKSTHHYPLSVMIVGTSLPEDFHFGSTRGEGTPAMPLCRQALALVRQVQAEIDST